MKPTCLDCSVRRASLPKRHSLKYHCLRLLYQKRRWCSLSSCLRWNCSWKFHNAQERHPSFIHACSSSLHCGDSCNTCPAASAARAVFVFTSFPSLFFFFFFFIFLFSIGTCNEMIAWNEKNEAAHWQWKQKGYSYWFLSYDFVGNANFHESYPSKIQLMAIQRACLLPPDRAFQESEGVPCFGKFLIGFDVLNKRWAGTRVIRDYWRPLVHLCSLRGCRSGQTGTVQGRVA